MWLLPGRRRSVGPLAAAKLGDGFDDALGKTVACAVDRAPRTQMAMHEACLFLPYARRGGDNAVAVDLAVG